VVALADGNARAAGIGHLLHFTRGDVRDFRPPEGPPGVILCNPPYGERLGEEKELRGLYALLGEVFGRCPGWSAWVFTGNQRLARAIGLEPAEEVPLFNGKIPCRLLRFDVR
jgi:putative N6-adenine-specific DNA methylase